MGCLKLHTGTNETPLKIAYRKENKGDFLGLDYYPFACPAFGGASQQSGRQFNAGEYRYAFNGKEYDEEWNGTGAMYDYGFRIYDSRLGRWLAVDPMRSKYPALSPYHFAANSPILLIDPNGKWVARINTAEDGTKYMVFVAEEGDDLTTLEVQLGVEPGTLTNSDASELQDLTIIPNETSVKLDFLDVVNNINSYLNTECLDKKGSNCAGFVEYVEGEFTDNMFVDPVKLTEKLESEYSNVSEEEAEIGDVITMQETLDAFVYRTEGEAKMDHGMTDEDIENYWEENIEEEPAHFMIVILKNKEGLKIQQVMQKSGSTPMNTSTVPDYPAQEKKTGDKGKSFYLFELAPMKGDQSPVYKKKESQNN